MSAVRLVSVLHPCYQDSWCNSWNCLGLGLFQQHCLIRAVRNKCHLHIQRNKHPGIRTLVQQTRWLTGERRHSRHARRASSVNKWHFVIKSIIVQRWSSKKVFHQSPSVIGRMRNPARVASPSQWSLFLYCGGWLSMMKVLLFLTLPVRGYGRFIHVEMHSTFIFSLNNWCRVPWNIQA